MNWELFFSLNYIFSFFCVCFDGPIVKDEPKLIGITIDRAKRNPKKPAKNVTNGIVEKHAYAW